VQCLLLYCKKLPTCRTVQCLHLFCKKLPTCRIVQCLHLYCKKLPTCRTVQCLHFELSALVMSVCRVGISEISTINAGWPCVVLLFHRQHTQFLHRLICDLGSHYSFKSSMVPRHVCSVVQLASCTSWCCVIVFGIGCILSSHAYFILFVYRCEVCGHIQLRT
jgi:hypothetical protein